MERMYPLTPKTCLFLWDNKEIIVVNHRFVVIVQDLVHMSIFNLRLNYIGFVLLSFFVAGLSVMSALYCSLCYCRCKVVEHFVIQTPGAVPLEFE